MKRRDIHTIIDGLNKWHQGWLSLNEIDWLLGAPLGSVATLFLENELADVEGRPFDGTTPQDAINCLVIWLAMRNIARRTSPQKAKRYLGQPSVTRLKKPTV